MREKNPMNEGIPRLQYLRGTDVDPAKLVEFWRRNDITLSATDTAEEVGRAAAINSNLFIVALSGDDIVGTVWGTFDGRRGYVVHLAVRKGERGLGLGRELMERVEAQFKLLGCHKVHLFVEEHNRAVSDFYRSLGWTERTDLTLFSRTLEER
jgi:ribosomal protein S18 acetylase RimI-like enzyme